MEELAPRNQRATGIRGQGLALMTHVTTLFFGCRSAFVWSCELVNPTAAD